MRYRAILRARTRLGVLLPRYTRLRRLMDFIEVVSKVALQMRLAGRPVGFIAREEGPQARIACISGPMPMIRMTRLRL